MKTLFKKLKEVPNAVFKGSKHLNDGTLHSEIQRKLYVEKRVVILVHFQEAYKKIEKDILTLQKMAIGSGCKTSLIFVPEKNLCELPQNVISFLKVNGLCILLNNNDFERSVLETEIPPEIMVH